MYNGIGLNTPRGSGTNGYVVRNLSFVRPPPNDRDRHNTNDFKSAPAMKKANEAILDHDRKRKVEVKCMELSIKLEDEGLDEEEIEKKVQELRESLLADTEKMEAENGKNLKEYATHQLSAAKEKANDKMKKALRINSGYVEGAAFDRELQVKLREERIAKKEAELTMAEERKEQKEKERRQRDKKERDSREARYRQTKADEQKRLAAEERKPKDVPAEKRKRSVSVSPPPSKTTRKRSPSLRRSPPRRRAISYSRSPSSSRSRSRSRSPSSDSSRSRSPSRSRRYSSSRSPSQRRSRRHSLSRSPSRSISPRHRRRYSRSVSVSRSRSRSVSSSDSSRSRSRN